MRKMLFIAGLLTADSAAHGQTQNSTTNCNVYGSTLNCNTTSQTANGIDWNAYRQQQQQINQQNQDNMNRAMQNLGQAIAASRERKRQRAEAEATQAAEEAQQVADKAREAAKNSAILRATSSDTAPVPAVPREPPVILRCTVGTSLVGLALYEKNGPWLATFTPDSVSWSGPVWRTAVSRIDMSLTSVAILSELDGAQETGACSIGERRF
jgi:multidrug efflux pump subunit AcrA (membrane-fusion protein)